MRNWREVLADIQAARHAGDPAEWEVIWARRRDNVQRPRVSWCALTRKWIVAPDGHRHRCGASWKADVAFRSWADAMSEANDLYRERLTVARAQFEYDYSQRNRR